MVHLILLLVCIASIEVFIRTNFLSFFHSILKVSKKVTFVIPQDKISDHWKEKVIPVYALRIMKYSLKILFTILMIISLFLVTDFFFKGFFELALSLIGILESLVFAFGYVQLRKLIYK